MKHALKLAAVALFAYAGADAASAAQLRVEPVLLELNAPAATGTLTLRNDGDTEVGVQTRVYRWSQSDGRENLDATTDVAASPPIVKLAPHADYIVRVVRVSKQPVRGEESYRVVVDQLPDARRQTADTVAILIRQSIPVFFRAPELRKASVTWSIARERGAIVVRATNNGDERLRIAGLRLRDNAGSTIGFGNGLVGYVLGQSTMTFNVAKPPPGFGNSGQVEITAISNDGPVNAIAPFTGGR